VADSCCEMKKPLNSSAPPGIPTRRRGRREALKERFCAPGCCQEFVQKRVPITWWLPRYKRADWLPDLIAGITVGLTLIPQSIAYASLAGLEPQVCSI
jgi:hypothetical protein